MIQRVQTLYLLAAAALMSLTLFLPLATLWQEGGNEVVIKAFAVAGIDGMKTQLPLYLGVMLSLPTLLPLVTIFLFKKRLVQIRLCVSEIVLLVGAIVMIALYEYRLFDVLSKELGTGHFTLGFASLMPVVAVIFVILALRGVAKDEALVRSLDRIR